MRKHTRVWLLLSILATVYLIYMVSVASIFTANFMDSFFLNLGRLGMSNLNSISGVINWTAIVTIVLWIIWGVLFIKDANDIE